MTPKKMSGKAVWAVILAVVLVVTVLILLFLQLSPSQNRESIVLPTTPVEAPAEPEPEAPPQADFLDVTLENVLTALRSLTRPTAYHQTYTVTVGVDDVQSVKTVELWVKGDLLHAEVSDQRQTRVLISNGTTACLWYDGSSDYVTIALTETMTEEDLLGLPAFDAFLNAEQAQVVAASYLVLEDPQVQCIYLCLQNDEDRTTRHWVSLENGLLYQSDILDNSSQVYHIRQTHYDALATEDETFRNHFRLPDGSDPFAS